MLVLVLLTTLGLAGPARADGSTGTLRGVLLSAAGSPSSGARVAVYREWDDAALNETVTDSTGAWSLELPLGTYQISFTVAGQTQWAFSRTTRAQSDLYPVVPWEPTVVNNPLIDVANLTGAVTSSNGYGLAGVCVRALSAANMSEVVATDCTDSTGRYHLTAGEQVAVVVEITDPTGTFAGGYVGSLSFAEATRFDLRRGQSVTAEGTLVRGSRLSGKVVDRNGRPVHGACPTVMVPRTQQAVVGQQAACSGADGVWTVRGLPVGVFSVQLLSTSFGERWIGGPSQPPGRQVRITRPDSARSVALTRVDLAVSGFGTQPGVTLPQTRPVVTRPDDADHSATRARPGNAQPRARRHLAGHRLR